MGLPVLEADDNSQGAGDDDIQKTQSLMERLVHAMEQLTSISKVPVLVIDGLEKITTVNQIRKASFLCFNQSSIQLLTLQDDKINNLEDLREEEINIVHFRTFEKALKIDDSLT